MKEEVNIGILVALFLVAVIGGALIFLNMGSLGGGYPINTTVYTTHERTVIPVPVPSGLPALLPHQVSSYSQNGYGQWRFGEGLGYEKRLDLMPPGYSAGSVTPAARLLYFFAMTDIHITDKESPARQFIMAISGGWFQAILR